MSLHALDYPFDVQSILRKRKALRAELLRTEGLIDLRVALLGGSTTSEIRAILELFLLREGLRPEFFESEYGQYYEDAVVDPGALRAFAPRVALVHTTHVNVLHRPALFSADADVDSCFAAERTRYEAIWRNLTGDLGCIVIQNNFDLPPVRSLGSLDSTALFGLSNLLMRLNLEFARAARANPKLIINDIHHLSARLGLDRWFDRNYWFSYKMAVSHYGTVHLAHSLSRLICAALGRTRKCLVLDLDNTVWGGVIGDDGVTGITVGRESAKGEAFVAFQEYCQQLRQRGILLAACSKNDQENAYEGFSHPDMVLKLESFSAFKANWEPKPQNIDAIVSDLNIGHDSLVFVDDNPAERALVRAQLPMVATPEVGADVSEFAFHLDRSGFFEAVSLNRDDASRAGFYADNALRTMHAAEFTDYSQYLDSLEMRAEIGAFSQGYLERICQLTNKTNQFNLTTRRYTLAEMEAIARGAEYVTLYGRLSDRFGDNGLVTVVVGRIAGLQVHVDLWLMSCRVLKRDLELAMLDTLAAEAIKRGANEIVGYYVPSPKNGMVADHYKSLGFEPVAMNEAGGASVWRLPLVGYIPRNKSIKEIVHG